MDFRCATLAFGASLAFITSIAPQALACKEESLPFTREELLAEAPVIVSATVVQAEPEGGPAAHTWRIKAQANHKPDEIAASSEYEFTATLLPLTVGVMCPSLPQPKAGDLWVLYLAQPASTKVIWAFTADYAKRFEPDPHEATSNR